MKKFFAIVAIAIATVFSANTLNAQMINTNNAEDYAKAMYGKKWTNTAMQVADATCLDRDGSISFSKTILAPGMSQNDLYYEMIDWFVCNYQNAIQMAEKSDGVIIARPYISNLTSSAAGWNAYKIDICPLIRVQVTDGQVNITYTLQDYGVAENAGGGNVATAVACGVIAGAIIDAATTPTHTTTTVVEHRHHGHHGHHGHSYTVVERTYHPHPHRTFEDALLISAAVDLATSQRYDDAHTVWPISQCYPFANNDSHKKASAKAFVVATTYSQMLMENIETALQQCQLAYRD